MRQRRVKVLKVAKNNSYFDCYECGRNDAVILGITGWDHMSEAEYQKLHKAVSEANSLRDHQWWYFTVEETPSNEVFETAKKFRVHAEKMTKEYEKKAAEEKKNRAAKAAERKKKQLEKLKKELGVK